MVIAPVPQRPVPRITVNELARFMVSTLPGQIGIIRRARRPNTPTMIRYKDARQPVCVYLADRRRSVNPLLAAEQMFIQRAEDPAQSLLRQDDARQSIEVLHALQGMTNQLATFDFHQAPNRQPKLEISGVQVSVRADLLVHGAARGEELIGAAILRMTQDDAETDAARAKRREMGLCVATVARLHLETNFETNRTIANRLCMSIDIQHGEVFVAPNSITRRIAEIDAACQIIAAMWDRA